MQEISTSDAHPSITRVSDAKETAFSSLRQASTRSTDCSPPWTPVRISTPGKIIPK
jgi:hypothetical protein